MFVVKNALKLACVGVFAITGAVVWAADPIVEGRGPDETAAVGVSEAEKEAPTLLMRSLGSTGEKLSDAGIQIGGLVEGSYTYSTSNPPGGEITGRAFDNKSQDPTLNQVMLF